MTEAVLGGPLTRLVLAVACLVCALASHPAAACDDLTCVQPLDPDALRPNTWDQWRLATDQVMAGRRASPLYRDTANRMRAWYALAEYDRERPWLSDEDALRARELAWIGTMSGLERMLRDTFERSDELGVLYRIGRTVGGADVQIEGRRGGARVRYNEVGVADARAAELELDEDRVRRRTPGAAERPEPLRLRGGVALRLVDLAEEEEELDPDLALVAYVELRNAGIDALRLQVADTRPKADAPQEGSWSVATQQQLLTGVDAVGRVSGRESRGWEPARASLGLSLRLPTELPWYLRPELSRGFPYEAPGIAPTPGEWRAMVFLRAQLRWSLPSQADSWPLGATVDPSDHDLSPR